MCQKWVGDGKQDILFMVPKVINPSIYHRTPGSLLVIIIAVYDQLVRRLVMLTDKSKQITS